MAHFAKVSGGTVIQVIVAEPEFFNTFVDTSPGEWIQTSYNTRGGVHYNPNTNTPSEDQTKALRKNYAGIGYNAGDNRTFKNGFKVSNYVYNVSAPGRIYETAGRKNPQGRAPFQQIDPSLPGTTFGKVQGFEGKGNSNGRHFDILV